MKSVFVDTSAFYALADKKDPMHDAAVSFLESNESPLLTSNYIFAESLSLLTKRLGKEAALRFGQSLKASETIRIFSLTPEYEDAAWAEFKKYKDKEFDYIDSTCFVVMNKHGIDAAFSFDRHFRQRGFELLPGLR